jgi:hypothetical protein
MMRKESPNDRMSSLFKAYVVVYLSIFETIRVQGDDGWVAWKAALLLGGCWMFLFMDLVLLSEFLGAPSSIWAIKGWPGVLMIALLYPLVVVPFLNEDRWKIYEARLRERQIRLPALWRNSVMIGLATLPVAFFLMAYVMRSGVIQ